MITRSVHFELITGLVYRIDTPAAVANSDFQFKIGQHGEVESLSESTTGGKHGLKFNTVKIKIVAKNYAGNFQITGFPNKDFSQAVALPFIPNVVVKISYGGNECQFIPETEGGKLKQISGTCGQAFDFIPC
jgi:hypothetical protein